MPLKLSFTPGTGVTRDYGFDEWRENFSGEFKLMGEAAVTAFRGMEALAKVRGRANIAAAGFSKRWQNTLRTSIFENHGIDAALRLWHKIPYANVFEDGDTIKPEGKYLWLPVEGLPKKAGRGGTALNPSTFERLTGQPLRYFVGPSGTPMLGATIRVNAKGPTKVSLSRLKRGEGSSTSKGVLNTVPVFVGIKRVVEPKKFGLEKMMEGVGAEFPQLYVNNREAQ